MARISAKVMAGRGYFSEAISTTVFPLRITGAARETKESKGGSSGVNTTTTPVGSVVVKLKCEVATGLTLPKTCEYLSVQPAK